MTSSRIMGVSDWFYAFLSYLGLYRPAKFVFVGLNNAGKSSLLQNCADNLPGFAVATSNTGTETLTKGIVLFTALDVGGHHRNRELWTKSICGASAIIYMVDAQDVERFDEAAAELHALSAAEGLDGVPFLVLGNKIDRPGAITSAQDIWDRLRVHEIENRTIKVFMCSVTTRVGYAEGIRWLSDKILL
ncbi:ADP-ribosylation factor family-domain-containing protein [Chaetomium fimeti]|uniref:Small COPII coat GTPase SAR1 n=1 Tax=Chaetomium fimeti TaxID=1854472 RepID=A0AAE0LUB3_9PEZI|nr:ADP-ribosylation factor family-domain-containing protein [Chaetomium fimeti]